jgi:DNA-binding beta-propeller fold protein YncE
VVELDHMIEIARVPTCTMPHGSRLNPQGTRQYSVCMMDDLLVEIDAISFAVSRHLGLAPGDGRGGDGPPGPPAGAPAAPGAHGTAHHAPVCSPTWAQPSADGATIYVACNKSSEILAVDAATWRVTQRWPAGAGVYNLAVTGDGRLLLATNKRGPSVSLVELPGGRELARVATARKIVHGVVVSPDDRYAFVSVEGIGSEPGTVEVIDLAARTRVGSADVGQMAGGIAVWRMEPARP